MKKVFKIKGMHCVSCAMNIDGTLEDREGVLSSNTNYAKSQTEVEFDATKINEEAISQMIKEIGYTPE